MTMITPSYLGETIEYSSLHACRSTLEDPTDDEFVFGSQLADIRHVFCLQLLTRFFTKLRSIGGTIQQNKEVLSGLGIGLGLSLRERVASKCEQAEQK